MTACPKCAWVRQPSDSHIHPGVCPQCGIAYQKYIERQPKPIHPKPSLLDHTQALARLCFGTGVLLMVIALVWGAYLLKLQYHRRASIISKGEADVDAGMR